MILAYCFPRFCIPYFLKKDLWHGYCFFMVFCSKVTVHKSNNDTCLLFPRFCMSYVLIKDFRLLFFYGLLVKSFQSGSLAKVRKRFWWFIWLFLPKWLKYGFQEKISLCCRCSSFLSLTFVEIKKSFTEMLLSINYKNFWNIFFMADNR